MSYSTQRVTSDGTLETLAISIEYFDRSEISILSDGVLITTGWTWVGTSDKTIQFAVPVANGVEITVLRSTDLSAIRHQFSLGAAFKATTVDEDFKQILHIAQEARENATITDIYQDLDMHGFKVKNVGAGTDPLDLVNQAQLTANNVIVQGYADDAEAFAEASEASALRSEAAANAAEAVGGVAIQIHAANEKTTPVSDDEFGLVDYAASNVLKRFKWSSFLNYFPTKIAPSTSGILTHSGDILLSGSGKRITADFSNANLTERVLLQSSITNGVTNLGLIPNGTGISSQFLAHSSSDASNSTRLKLYCSSTLATLSCDKVGSGSFLPLTSEVGGFKNTEQPITGGFLVTSTGLLGYGTGSGGTVTQGTSKSTAVPLNTPNGVITMHNAALAAGASVVFTLNNSLIAIPDGVVVNHASTGGTANAYQIVPLTVGTGTVAIRVTNITAGSLSEAVTVSFKVIKGATA